MILDRVLFVAAALCAACLPALAGAGAAARDTAEECRLSADGEVVDFGTVLTGESVTRGIRVTNPGPDPFRLVRIAFTCGCAVPRIILSSGEVFKLENAGDGPGRPAEGFQLTLDPEESCVVELDFTPVSVAGRVMRQIFFYEQGAEAPALVLPVTAEVKPAFTLEPRSFDFGRVAWGEPVLREMTIRSAGAGDFSVASVEGVPPFFECRATRVPDAPAPTWKLALSIERPPPAGLQQFVLLLRIDSERIDSLRIYGCAVIEPDIVFEADPGTGDSINFGVIQRGAGAAAEVEIINRNAKIPYEIDGVELDSEWAASFETKVHTIVAGRHYKVFLKLKPDLGVRFFRGRIILLSKHAALGRKELPFKGWINLDGPSEPAEEKH